MRPDDNDVLYDIHFSGDNLLKHNLWFSPFTLETQKRQSQNMETSLFYKPSFIDRLEKEWLMIPLQKGWTEEVHYIGNKIYQAKLKINGNQYENWDMNKSVPFDINIWDYIKIGLGINTRKEQFEFEAIG